MTIILHVPDNSMWRGQVDHLSSVVDDEVVMVDRADELESLPESVRETAVALIGFRATAADLALLPALRLVAIPMAGVNTVDLDAAAARGIQVVNAHANGMWVAERALALTLAFRGMIVAGDRDLRRGCWHGFAAGEGPRDSWESLFDTTVAILGTGSIGQWAARFFQSLGAHTRGFRRRAGTDDLPEGLFGSVTTDVSEAVAGAQTVVATLPLTPTTRGLIGDAELAQMRGALLVNVGRGEVIDEAALYRALFEGVLAGAALDTWYRYPDPPGSVQLPSRFPFHELHNVLLSPHLGGYTAAATAASAREVVDTVARWIADGAPADAGGTVDTSAGY